MMKRSIYTLFAAAGLMFSCQHEPGHQPAPPEIDITNPESGIAYHNGDTIHMEAIISDEDALHEASIMIYSPADTSFEYEPTVHDLESFVVDTFWVVNGIGAPVSSFVTFHAENHHEKTTTINLSIALQP